MGVMHGYGGVQGVARYEDKDYLEDRSLRGATADRRRLTSLSSRRIFIAGVKPLFSLAVVVM